MTNPNTLPAPIDLGLRALIPSVVRTLVPIVIALVVRVGFSETAIDNDWLERALTVLVTMGYYVVARVLERNWSKLGWLLGYPAQPVYVKGEVIAVVEENTPPTITTTVETVEDPPKVDE